jgi:hypothetical protein
MTCQGLYTPTAYCLIDCRLRSECKKRYCNLGSLGLQVQKGLIDTTHQLDKDSEERTLARDLRTDQRFRSECSIGGVSATDFFSVGGEP